MSAAANITAWAMRYIQRFGFSLTPLEGKSPFLTAWNTDAQLIRKPAAARACWGTHPEFGIGVCLEPSGLVSLDADAEDHARQVLAAHGVDLDELISVTPTIIGRAPRLEFSAPAGIKLGHQKIVWPALPGSQEAVTVLELRAGRVQDVLPPSIHPDTRSPYRWHTPPGAGFPPLPVKLLALWQDFERFKRRARALCPWAAPESEPEPVPQRAARARAPGEPSVIRAFNDAHDVIGILEAHGYKRVVGKRRWKSPNGTGAPGVVLLPSGRAYCHHSDDIQLVSERTTSGKQAALDAFDLFRIFDHGGDYRAATREAARLLGLNSHRERA